MQARAQVLPVVATLVLGLSGLASAETMVFLRGDLDNDGAVTERDIFHAIDYWFSQRSVASIESADVNDDGQFDVADVNLMGEIVFTGTARTSLPERVEFTRGDVNGDGALTQADHDLLRSYLDGDTNEVEILDSMDVAEDGFLTDADLRGLARLIAAQPEPRGGSTGSTSGVPGGGSSGAGDEDRRGVRPSLTPEELAKISAMKRKRLAGQGQPGDEDRRTPPADPRVKPDPSRR